MNWKEMLAQANKLMEEVKAVDVAEASAEELEQIGEKHAEAKALMAKAGQLKEIEQTALELQQTVEAEQQGDSPVEGSEFKTWGDFLFATWLWTAHQKRDPRLKVFKDDAPSSKPEVKDMVESTGAAGGFLVPVEFLAELQAAMAENAIVRPRATILPMRRRQLDVPVLDQTGTTAGIPHWFGGMQFYWAEEAHEKTLSDPTFRKISLVAHKMIGYTRASDELLDDSAISLEAFLSGPLGFAGGATWMEDYAFLQGTGAGQPLGVIPATATINVARATAGTITYADICNMLMNFLPTGKGVWVISQSALSTVVQISGPAGNPSYVWQPNAREKTPAYLFGYPVIWSEKSPAMGTAGDILLADFQYYLIGDRQATTVESTKFDRWRYDETSWRMVHRVDGQPWLSQPLTYQDGATQVSPFVILAGAGAS